MKTLTDLEVDGFHHDFNLADGHAYQDLGETFADIVDALPTLWTTCEHTRVPDAEQRFRAAFATLAGSEAMMTSPFFKVCPTASNAIDVVAAALAQMQLETTLIEPTFDNLSLLLRRRGVRLRPLAESRLNVAALSKVFASGVIQGALFIVQPNNPTGRCLSSAELTAIAELCVRHRTVLVLDNSFRLYNRNTYDDYAILHDVGVSYIAFEDTGKVFPLHDLKASLLLCSNDLQALVNDVYNETYLCNSRFTLLLLEMVLQRTLSVGLSAAVWSLVDTRRDVLRASLAGTGFSVDATALHSQISVEWLDCSETGLSDWEVARLLEDSGVLVLPGTLFYWSGVPDDENHRNIRVALMKPAVQFQAAIDRMASALRRGVAHRPAMSPTSNGGADDVPAGHSRGNER